MTRLNRNQLIREIGTFFKAVAGKRNDPFGAYDVEDAMRELIYKTWQIRIEHVKIGIDHLMRKFWMGGYPNASEIMGIFNSWLNRRYLEISFRADVIDGIEKALNIGKASVDAQYKKQTGHEPVKKDATSVAFGIIFGLTEQHALQALTNQLAIAAGGFWDDEMSESVKKEVESWFTGTLTKDDLNKNLTKLIDDRLSIDGAKSLPGSYFDGLTEHYIVRARNVGSVYRAKDLGAKKYRIVNPNDKRTSGICRTLSASGMVFEFGGAEDKVTGILGARTQTQLKTVAPFLTDHNAASETAPVPPLHWRCRSWMSYIFEGGLTL